MVSVVIPAYNAEKFIAEAIQSVLGQTWRDFEFIIIDDGSRDQTKAIADSFAKADTRISVFSQSNQGVANSINAGLKRARYELVAIMHADDVMLPTRLERQVTFLNENPDVGVISSLVFNIDTHGRVIARATSSITTKAAAKLALARHEVVAFHHPAVMFRKSVVLQAGGYRQEFVPAEDVDLWCRIMERGHLVMVLPEFLLSYRIHASSASVSNAWGVARKYRWVMVCARRRREGKTELTWEEFLQYLEARPWPQKINENRKDLAKLLYKQAVEFYAGRQRRRMFIPLFGAFMLQPIYVAQQLSGKLSFRKAA